MTTVAAAAMPYYRTFSWESFYRQSMEAGEETMEEKWEQEQTRSRPQKSNKVSEQAGILHFIFSRHQATQVRRLLLQRRESSCIAVLLR
jgi:hypothetical protein